MHYTRQQFAANARLENDIDFEVRYGAQPYTLAMRDLGDLPSGIILKVELNPTLLHHIVLEIYGNICGQEGL